MKQETSCSCLFDDYGIKKYTKIGPHHSYVFLKICNNFENSFPSTKQLRTAASSFPQKRWWYLIEVYCCQRKCTWTSNLCDIFVRWKCHEFAPLEDIESQDKSVHIFFYNQLNFSSQPQVAKRCYLRLKVANFWLSFATTYILLDVKTTSSV